MQVLDPVGAVPALYADCSPAAVRAAVAFVAEAGRIDLLVNNAGAAWGAPAEDYPVDAWDKVMNLNVRGYFILSQHIGDLDSAVSRAHQRRVGEIPGVRVLLVLVADAGEEASGLERDPGRQRGSLHKGFLQRMPLGQRSIKHLRKLHGLPISYRTGGGNHRRYPSIKVLHRLSLSVAAVQKHQFELGM